MRLAALGIAAALVCSLVATAGAQPGNTPPAVPPPQAYQPPNPYAYGQPTTHTERYGLTIATVDGVCMAVVVVGAIVFVSGLVDESTSDSSGAVAVGAVMMVGGSIGVMVGGPVVHYRKHNSSAAWKSLGLRVGLPLVGSLIGQAMRDNCDPADPSCTQSDSDIGSSLGGIGLLAAMAIDWFVLAKHEVTDYAYAPAPYVATTRDGGLTVGLGARF